MKHSIAVRFLVFLLTAFCLVMAFAGTVCIVAMEGAGLYVNRLDELQDHEYESIADTISASYAKLYAVNTLGDVPYLLKQNLFSDPTARSDADHWCIQLWQDGQLLETVGNPEALGHYAAAEQYTIAPLYPIVSPYPPGTKLETPDETVGDGEDTGAVPDEEVSLVPEDYLYYEQSTNWLYGSFVTNYFYYYQAPSYTVTVFLQEEVLESSSLHILTMLYPVRYSAIAVLVIGLILFAAGMVYLMWSAGTTADGTVRPGGLNKIPLDVYALIVTFGIWLLMQLFSTLSSWMRNDGPHPGNLSLLAANLLAVTVLGLAFLYALAAQVKVKGSYWWHHSFLGWLLDKLWQGLKAIGRGCVALVSLLPMIWQWLLIAGLMSIAALLSGIWAMWYSAAAPVLWIVLLLCGIIVIYGGYAFGSLMTGAIHMSQGDLNHKISTKYLFGSFKRFAEELNNLSETAKLAAEKEMRSERMKSELITNVSHDIKTPLTSIINFVDLLQKPHTAQQEAEYLEVLSRQSDRMKKLISDLIELSRANSGNITVNITDLNAVETVNQALGEFSDKLDNAQLTYLFLPPEQPVMIRADGRLVWRILSNLLSNTVKYAMPGTRLYCELEQADGLVMLSLKNISREPLTVQAEDLMERFVRGDTARFSEGSGLGLNIAKSLMEVQGGSLQLQIDGDLFKVTLIFPTK